MWHLSNDVLMLMSINVCRTRVLENTAMIHDEQSRMLSVISVNCIKNLATDL